MATGVGLPRREGPVPPRARPGPKDRAPVARRGELQGPGPKDIKASGKVGGPKEARLVIKAPPGGRAVGVASEDRPVGRRRPRGARRGVGPCLAGALAVTGARRRGRGKVGRVVRPFAPRVGALSLKGVAARLAVGAGVVVRVAAVAAGPIAGRRAAVVVAEVAEGRGVVSFLTPAVPLDARERVSLSTHAAASGAAVRIVAVAMTRSGEAAPKGRPRSRY